MKTCICKKYLTSGSLICNVGNKYRYETWLIDIFTSLEPIKMYRVYFTDDYSNYTNFAEFDFEQYFISMNKLRKEKLEKIRLL